MSLKLVPYLCAIFLSVWLSGAVHADPPARVGCISYLEGAVSFHGAGWHSQNSAPTDAQPNDSYPAQWAPAQLNYPITTGDALWAEADGRLEVQIGSAEVRADHATEIDIARLDDDMTLLRVDQGTVNVHVHTLTNDHFAVMTPHGQIDLIKPGSYHIEIDDAVANDRVPQVRVTTLEGEAHVDTARAVLEILPGERAIIDGDPINVTLTEGNATEFDNWALLRERREQDQVAARYVSPDMTGYTDLDAAGRWGDEPDYGTVWYPAVADDWAPYRYGHWTYIDPWGWTWIDNASWGFAPFHYGRWVYVHHAWGWCPGARVARPVYAPALVAFVGGAHGGVSVNSGTAPIGWIPLGPHEVYRPYYRTSVNYVRNININHVDKTVINNITLNAAHENHFRNRDAATVVNGETFTHGRPVFGKTLPIAHDAAANVQPLPDVNHLKPEHDAINHDAAINAARHHDAVNATRNMSNTAPMSSPADSHPFPRARIPVPQPNPRAEMNRINNNNAAPPITRMPSPQSERHSHEDIHEHAPANLPHPQQNTQLRPTPQGWQRAPMQPAAQHPEPHETHRPTPQQGQQQHRDRS